MTWYPPRAILDRLGATDEYPPACGTGGMLTDCVGFILSNPPFALPRLCFQPSDPGLTTAGAHHRPLHAACAHPIPNRPMADEPFKATDEDWQRIEEVALNRWDRGRLDLRWDRTIRELRDRVAALEKKARTAEECNDVICRRLDEIQRKGTGQPTEAGIRLASYSIGKARPIEECGKDRIQVPPTTVPTPPPLRPSDEELWEVQLAAWRQVYPGAEGEPWSPRTADHLGVATAHRALYNYGFQHGLAAGRAEQGGTPEPTHPQYFSSHHAIAGEIWGMLPDAPEPNQAPAGDGGLVEEVKRTMQDLRGWDEVSRAIILAVAKWLRRRGNHGSAAELEREAQR